jgi:type VI secretion system protein ImpA
MPIENIDSLLEPISAESPCGPDLEYDPAFLELDRLSEGKPEQQMGDTIVPAQEPDWKEVGNRALALLGKTKDLRIAVRLTRARLNTEGFQGFSEGLKVTRGIVEKFWDGFYPVLDPEDGNDPTFRVNILMSLCDGSFFIDRLRTIPVVSSRSFGRFSMRDVAVATGELPPPADTEPPKTAAIDGAFMDCPLPELQATASFLQSAMNDLTAIEAFVAEKVGASSGTNYAKLFELLRAADKLVSGHVADRTAVAAGTGEPGADGAAGGSGGPGGGRSIAGEVNSREDVIRVLDKICLYYQRLEPSSPIPLLLQRAKRLVSASFMDIVRDLAPDGLAQIETLRGKDESESS